jgi:hypothetical protein
MIHVACPRVHRPPCAALVKATRLLYGLRLRSLCGAATGGPLFKPRDLDRAGRVAGACGGDVLGLSCLIATFRTGPRSSVSIRQELLDLDLDNFSCPFLLLLRLRPLL